MLWTHNSTVVFTKRDEADIGLSDTEGHQPMAYMTTSSIAHRYTWRTEQTLPAEGGCFSKRLGWVISGKSQFGTKPMQSIRFWA